MLMFILGCLVGGSIGFVFAGVMAASKKEAPTPEIKKDKSYEWKHSIQ